MAVATGGLHVVQGSLIWDAYREFEMIHLSLITEKDSIIWREQASRVVECFKRQLSIPLLNIEDTYSELQHWIKHADPPAGIVNETSIEWAYTNSRRLLERYRPFEDELLSNPDHLDVYQRYIKVLKQPTHIICLYERVLAELSINPDLWLQFAQYVKKLEMPTYDIIHRGLRNCPWSEDLWIFQIQELEQRGREFDEITLKLEQGLESIVPLRGLKLWLSYLEYSHRNNNLTLNQLNQIFEQAQKHLGAETDPEATVSRFHARILANAGDMNGARCIWINILRDSHKGMANAWLEYIALERLKGCELEVRAAFQKALAVVKDWPQSICEEWLMFERECGTLESMRRCVEKCSTVPKAPPQMKQERIEGDEGGGYARAPNGKRKVAEGPQQSTREKRRKAETQPKEEGKFASLATASTSQVETKPQLDIHALDAQATVFVSNLSSSVTDARLWKVFPGAKQIDLMRDVKGKSRGHGYVQFSTAADAVTAIGRDREPLDGRPIFISRFKPAREERQHAFSKEKEENKLFVKGLPYSVTQKQVELVFSQFGAAKVRLVLQRSGRPKGLAYVEYPTKEEAAAALKATDGTVLNDCTMSVAISAPPQKAIAGTSTGGEFWRREPSRPFKSRLQVPLIPRVLSTGSKSGATAVTTEDKGDGQQSAPPKTNQEFRDMLLGKK